MFEREDVHVCQHGMHDKYVINLYCIEKEMIEEAVGDLLCRDVRDVGAIALQRR